MPPPSISAEAVRKPPSWPRRNQGSRTSPFMDKNEPEHNTYFCVLFDQVSTEELPMNTETASFAPRSSEQLIVPEFVADTAVEVEDFVNELVLVIVTKSQKSFDNYFSAAFENFAPSTVQKVVNSPGFLRQFSDAVVAIPVIISKLWLSSNQEKEILWPKKPRSRIGAGNSRRLGQWWTPTQTR